MKASFAVIPQNLFLDQKEKLCRAQKMPFKQSSQKCLLNANSSIALFISFFADPQVRKLTIDALIFVAKRLEHRQFIFITPQDLSSVTPDPMLRILKLKAPQRTQLAGGPSQQTLDFSQFFFLV